jgi:hypothetical protein
MAMKNQRAATTLSSLVIERETQAASASVGAAPDWAAAMVCDPASANKIVKELGSFGRSPTRSRETS